MYTNGGVDTMTEKYSFDYIWSKQSNSYCSDSSSNACVVGVLVVRQPAMCGSCGCMPA